MELEITRGTIGPNPEELSAMAATNAHRHSYDGELWAAKAEEALRNAQHDKERIVWLGAHCPNNSEEIARCARYLGSAQRQAQLAAEYATMAARAAGEAANQSAAYAGHMDYKNKAASAATVAALGSAAQSARAAQRAVTAAMAAQALTDPEEGTPQ